MVRSVRIMQVFCMSVRMSPVVSALALLFAVTMKVVAWWVEPNYTSLILSSVTVTVVALIGESCLAMTLLLAKSRLPIVGATVLHLSFLGYGMYLLMTDQSSCQCFGVMTPSVEWMILLNLVISVGLVSMLVSGLPRVELILLPLRQGVVCAAVCGTLISFVICFTFLRPFFASERLCDDLAAGRLTVVRPKEWSGRLLPFLECLNNGRAEITRGDWDVLLYSGSCRTCQHLITTNVDNPIFQSRLVAINLDGGGEASVGIFRSELMIAPVPTVVRIRNGLVIEVLEPEQLIPLPRGV